MDNKPGIKKQRQRDLRTTEPSLCLRENGPQAPAANGAAGRTYNTFQEDTMDFEQTLHDCGDSPEKH